MQEEVHNLARENGMGRCRPVNGLGSGQTYLGLSVDPIRIKGQDNILSMGLDSSHVRPDKR